MVSSHTTSSSGAMLPVPGALMPFEDGFVVGDAIAESLEVRCAPVDLLLRWAPGTARLRRIAGREREPERGPPEVGFVVDRTSVRGSAAFAKKHDPCAEHQIGDDLGDTDGSLRDLLVFAYDGVERLGGLVVEHKSTAGPPVGSAEVCGWLVLDGIAKSDIGVRHQWLTPRSLDVPAVQGPRVGFGRIPRSRQR